MSPRIIGVVVAFIVGIVGALTIRERTTLTPEDTGLRLHEDAVRGWAARDAAHRGARTRVQEAGVQKARDEIQQFRAVAEDGTPFRKCLHARFVARAILQAGPYMTEAETSEMGHYADWKGLEVLNCQTAAGPAR